MMIDLIYVYLAPSHVKDAKIGGSQIQVLQK